MQHLDTRGATPAFTAVKHALRDWIESRLAGWKWNRDEAIFAYRLNEELRRAGLFGEDDTTSGEQDNVGYLGPVRFDGPTVVITSVGIQCGYDESAYLYEDRDHSWQRVWQSEQTDYTERDYRPQYIVAVQASWPDRKKAHRLVLVLGSQPWCESNWRSAYYQLWRIKTGDATQDLLISEQSSAFDPEAIQGHVTGDDALIEFHTGSIDADVHNREAIRHYTITGSTVLRDDPIAVSPRDFVDEWLTQPWTESVAWSRSALEPWHRQFHKGGYFGEFTGTTLHCSPSDVWQVGVAFEKSTAYFRLRWVPPYRFTMLEISETPSPACKQPDPVADQRRSLFQ